MVALASFYNWKKGAYFTNEWFVGSIRNNTFHTAARGLLDYGQYYAARSGTSGDLPGGRQVKHNYFPYYVFNTHNKSCNNTHYTGSWRPPLGVRCHGMAQPARNGRLMHASDPSHTPRPRN